MTDRTRKLVALAILLALAGSARAESKDDPWAAFRFLAGEWVGEGDGAPGKGSGSFTLTPELGGKVLVRRNRADYPAAGGRPAVAHEDLMVIEPPAAGRGARATYWDNEGHVIHYMAAPSADGKGLTFLSDVVAGAPRFRLTYTKLEADKVNIKFEFAPPGKPDAFTTYLEGKVRRKEAAGTAKPAAK
jgi:hypothetical protein